jgi:putative ABC transport system substrate-binding protein
MVKDTASKAGLKVVEATVSNTSEVMQAAQSLVGRVDAIYIPTDNTVSSSVESVIKVAEANALPVVVGEAAMVDRGALATLGIDYNKLGKQTAEITPAVLSRRSHRLPRTFLERNCGRFPVLMSGVMSAL